MKKYEQEIFNPPRKSQVNILHEAKMQEKRNKIKNLSAHANQLKALGEHKRSTEHFKEIYRQEQELKALIMSPQALEIPREIFHGQ